MRYDTSENKKHSHQNKFEYVYTVIIVIIFFFIDSDQGIEDSSFNSSINSLTDAISRAESLDVPWGHSGYGGGPTLAMEMPHFLSTSHSDGDSGFGGPPSPYSSTCGSFLSPGSLTPTPQGTPSSRQGRTFVLAL